MKVDTQAPTTTDNVPTTWQKVAVTVTLAASDAGPSGVDATTYEILSATGTPGPTETYDTAKKPALRDGEKIRYTLGRYRGQRGSRSDEYGGKGRLPGAGDDGQRADGMAGGFGHGHALGHRPGLRRGHDDVRDRERGRDARRHEDVRPGEQAGAR